MSQVDIGKFYAENIGLVNAVAHKGFGRLQAVGASVDFDDVVQDLSITFIKSFEAYDPDKGKFSTYFYQAAYHRLAKMMEVATDERINNKVFSIEEMSSWSAGDEDLNLLETIDSKHPCPAESYESATKTERILKAVKKLSPLSQIIAEWTFDPPYEVEREYEARVAYTTLARSHGEMRRAISEIDIGFVCSLLVKTGYRSATVRRARTELENVVRREFNE